MKGRGLFLFTVLTVVVFTVPFIFAFNKKVSVDNKVDKEAYYSNEN